MEIKFSHLVKYKTYKGFCTAKFLSKALAIKYAKKIKKDPVLYSKVELFKLDENNNLIKEKF